MLRLAIKLLLFSAVFLAYDKIYLLVANRSAEVECDKRLEFIINGEINKDIIIAGSSRGSRDIIASQIEAETGFSTYNLCYCGSNVEFHDFIVRSLVKFNSSPKTIILVVDDNAELLEDETINFRRDRLYPLVKYPYIWQELVILGERKWLLSKFLILHRLNKANFDLRTKVFTPLDTIMRCGSMPISWQRKGRKWNYVSKEREYNITDEVAEKVKSYKDIIKICSEKSINLIVVFPPSYQTPSSAFEARIKELSGDQAYFYSYNHENPIYKNKDFYYDEAHLIREGAVIFTNEVCTFLKQMVRNNNSD